mgnify:CR=1 FL=1
MSCSQISSGFTPREAYIEVTGFHTKNETNVMANLYKYKRGMDRAAAAAPAAKPTCPKPQSKKPQAKLLPAGKRLRSDQVDAIEAQKLTKKMIRSAAHKQATLELQAAQVSGRSPNGKAKEIVDRLNEEHELTPNSVLTKRGIAQAVALGKAGTSPEAAGPKPKVQALSKALGIRAQLMQLTGHEQGSRKLLASAMASLKGTDLECLLDNKHKRVRMVRAIKAACPELRTKEKKSADDRRAEWLCR